MENPTVENLKVLTQEFFSLHWNAVLLGSDYPEWSDIYEFTGSMPNHDKQGVYAFVKNGVVTYIGVGASSNVSSPNEPRWLQLLCLILV